MLNLKSEVSINTREGSLLASKLLPMMAELLPRAFGTTVGMMRYVISPALLMPITPAILFGGSVMLDSSTEADQVSQFSTGTPGGSWDLRYDFGMELLKE